MCKILNPLRVESFTLKRGIPSQEGAVAHLIGQLDTKSKVRVRIPVRAKSIYHCSSVSTQHYLGYLGLLRPSESKGSEESNGKVPHKCRMPRTIKPLLLVPRCLD
ncbi:hypothetical protein PoB_003576600 [Plakobranchus ocellatus]|uniref:Uncharacterized protein n=1 Tax=Plakobranchus ocellatus TaxID=259542 RepID=A0AAV4AM36_9GAST|nr:hypothetical protein PoB_003576600 [Plakobranchus ocellatus]